MRGRAHRRLAVRGQLRRAVHRGRGRGVDGHARLREAGRSDRPFRPGLQVVVGRDGQPARVQPVGLLRLRQARVGAPALRRSSQGLAHYPVMRWARAVDPTDASRDDPVLTTLMKWATTVVVAPVRRGRDVLAESLRKFPAEFLLFSQHVERLGLEDRDASGTARSITLDRDDDGALVLDDASRRSVWVVRSHRHQPSKAALEDGGYCRGQGERGRHVGCTAAKVPPRASARSGRTSRRRRARPSRGSSTRRGSSPTTGSPCWQARSTTRSSPECCRGSSATPCRHCTGPIAPPSFWTSFPHVARKPGTTRTTCSTNR